MTVFIELTTDSFDSAARMGGTGQGRAGLTSVRRPLRGLEIKEDTYAYIKVIRADGTSVQLVDSSAPGGEGFSTSNFILQSVQEQRMERHQVIETFGDTYLFLFGESPRFLQVQAVLLNSNDFNWEAEFDYNYDNYLRGTKAVEQGARCYLFYDDNVVEGYILNTTKQKDSQEPLLVQLSFQFFVTNTRNVSIIKTQGTFPVRKSATIPEGIDLYTPLDANGINSLWASSNTQDQHVDTTQQPVLRGAYLDNKDEYTTGMQPTMEDQLELVENSPEEVTELPAAVAAFLESSGVKPSSEDLRNPAVLKQKEEENKKKKGKGKEGSAGILPNGDQVLSPKTEYVSSPTLADKLGLGPTFLPGGVGIGSAAGRDSALATFGAAASFSAGGFLGGDFGTAVANASISADGIFGSSGSKFWEVNAKSFGSASLTGRVGGLASAYASARAGAQAGFESFAYASSHAAASVGGYAGASAYLGASGGGGSSSGSYVASSGAGASVTVGGQATAFASATAGGTLTNTGLTPGRAMSQSADQWSWSDSWSWPSSSNSPSPNKEASAADLNQVFSPHTEIV